VVETFFRIPGLGPFFVNSVLNRDLFVVSGVVLVYSVLLILLNLLSELAQAALDRRIRLG
jgi:ABC-type dipeptide/oligopeptide/nickel transport system permease component